MRTSKLLKVKGCYRAKKLRVNRVNWLQSLLSLKLLCTIIMSAFIGGPNVYSVYTRADTFRESQSRYFDCAPLLGGAL